MHILHFILYRYIYYIFEGLRAKNERYCDKQLSTRKIFRLTNSTCPPQKVFLSDNSFRKKGSKVFVFCSYLFICIIILYRMEIQKSYVLRVKFFFSKRSMRTLSLVAFVFEIIFNSLYFLFNK